MIARCFRCGNVFVPRSATPRCMECNAQKDIRMFTIDELRGILDAHFKSSPSANSDGSAEVARGGRAIDSAPEPGPPVARGGEDPPRDGITPPQPPGASLGVHGPGPFLQLTTCDWRLEATDGRLRMCGARASERCGTCGRLLCRRHARVHERKSEGHKLNVIGGE